MVSLDEQHSQKRLLRSSSVLNDSEIPGWNTGVLRLNLAAQILNTCSFSLLCTLWHLIVQLANGTEGGPPQLILTFTDSPN